MGKRKRELLSESGIVHLKNSFVHPTDENGLLHTVGGMQEQPLMLASGAYGYGIPVSVAIKAAEAAQAQVDEAEKDPDRQMVREINGGVWSSSELNKDRSGVNKEMDDEAMTVGELVRSIGGARDAPLRRCDVVEDRSEAMQIQDDHDSQDKPEEDPQADEFYASLGLQNPNEKQVTIDLNGDQTKGSANGINEVLTIDQNSTKFGENKAAGVADFYKTYTKYYYSVDSNPYGDQRLEFGLPIDEGKDNDMSQIDYGAGDQTIIQLARMAKMRAKQAKAAVDALEKAKKAKALDGKGEGVENEADIYDPLPMEVIQTGTAEELGITVDTTLEQYWEFVKEDPHDFNRWIYLIHYAENSKNIIKCRKVYSAFLPLFPYCFGYWKRYSDIEKNFNYYGRAITILEKGLEFIPLSVDLWLYYIALYREIHALDPNYFDMVREEYEKALNTCGMEFRSDSLWEAFIQFEIDNKNLKRGFSLYGRVLQVPTRLYNRHWDNAGALIRDHHPRDFLEKDVYEYMRKKGCKKLRLKYKEEPEFETGEIRKPSKPEDELMDYTKEKVLKSITEVHEKCEIECEKRWAYEDKIRRPYFHTKPLDKKQLRNWEEYLDFEINNGDHDRIVLLFERCLISCAFYESFWCKYSRYLESYHKKNSSSNQEISVHFQKVQENTEIGSQRATEEEEERISDVKFTLNEIMKLIETKENRELLAVADAIDSLADEVIVVEYNDKLEVAQQLHETICSVSGDESVKISSSTIFTLAQPYIEFLQDCYFDKVSKDQQDSSPIKELRRKIASPYLSGDSDLSGLPVNSGEQNSNDIGPSGLSEMSSLLSVPTFPPVKYAWQEAVRDVYKRACVVHCPKKPTIRMQWAAFEEELGNSNEARELIRHVLLWFPNHVEAKFHLIELDRRSKNYETVEKLFEDFLKTVSKKEERSILCMKYARFLHKEINKTDKALQILRNAIKRDKTNIRLYTQVVEICYEQYAVKKKPVFAALDLFLRCKEFSDEQRLLILRKKLLIEQEHGNIKNYRDTLDQVNILEEITRKRKHEEELKKEEEARLVIGYHNPALQPFPVPDWSAVQKQQESGQKTIPIEFEPLNDNPRETQVISRENTENEKKEMEESAAFKQVAPPPDLDLDNYGYSSKHPDYKIAEYMAQKEYEQLESKGYPDQLKDKEGEGSSRKRKVEEDGPIYIVQPKSATMYLSCTAPTALSIPPVPGTGTGKEPQVIELEAPQQLSAVAVPSTSPCINVPEWFIKEGGELCLSETRAGFSVIRYWPHFLNDIGEKRMFKAVRRSVKWHQKQRVVWSKWRYIPRLVSWLGPCDWGDRGLEMKKNEDWPPEVLDLLHRINQITQHEFNSCFMNLYRTGHDSHPWHADIHPAYGSNPSVATISLGHLRLFEMKRRGPVTNFIRFPLFPGSLLIMEGACQEDWSHQIPKDPKVEGERISLVFRVMHAIESQQNIQQMKSPEEEEKEMDEDDETITEPEIGTSSLPENMKKKEKSSKEDKPTTKNGKDIASSRITNKESSKDKKEVAKISSSNSSKSSDPSKSEDPDVEIIDVIEKPSQTRILFHNKK